MLSPLLNCFMARLLFIPVLEVSSQTAISDPTLRLPSVFHAQSALLLYSALSILSLSKSKIAASIPMFHAGVCVEED